MTDREKYLSILDRFYRGRGGSLLTKDECEAMEYAISSIKTDLKYDLLYEETREKIPVNLHITEIKKHQSDFSDLGGDNNVTSTDCISRIETIDYLCKHCPDDGECFKDCDEIKHLRQMPSVTPQEPKTGHWVKIKPYPLQMHDYECSECGHETDDNTESYCSDCGARMIESQESESDA